MTISRQNLSIIIVTFKSENVIHQCLKSIPKEVQIIIVDNSNDKSFKENIESTYGNVKCILSPVNLGMGSGNNLGIKNIKTDYVLILNPDVVLYKNTIDEIINKQNNFKSFALIAPISDEAKYPNYKIDKNQNINFENKMPFKALSVDGYAMLLNLKKLSKYDEFKNFNYFDESFFMYLENEDLCRRIKKINENIYVIPSSKISHLGGKAVDIKFQFEIEMSRNWHWIWSKFYYNKKHSNYLIALFKLFPTFLSALLKYLFYSIYKEEKKRRLKI